MEGVLRLPAQTGTSQRSGLPVYHSVLLHVRGRAQPLAAVHLARRDQLPQQPGRVVRVCRRGRGWRLTRLGVVHTPHPEKKVRLLIIPSYAMA